MKFIDTAINMKVIDLILNIAKFIFLFVRII